MVPHPKDTTQTLRTGLPEGMDPSIQEDSVCSFPPSAPGGQNGMSGPCVQLAGGGQTDTLTFVFIAWLHIGRRRYNHCVKMSGPDGGMNSQGLQVDPGGHNTSSGSEGLMNDQAEKPISYSLPVNSRQF